MKILVVDDDVKIVSILRAYLEKDDFTVLVADNGLKGLELALLENPDAILLDIMMPGMDGLALCEELRKINHEVPIIMITAKAEERDRIDGLELGADDYIVKPFSPKEVIARIKAVMRRAHRAQPSHPGEKGYNESLLSTDEIPKDSSQILKVGELTLNRMTRDVRVGQTYITLTPTEYALLETMMKFPGRVYSRTMLLECVQDIAFEGYDRTIDSHIKNLRKKLKAPESAPYSIKTVYGVGYKLVGDYHA